MKKKNKFTLKKFLCLLLAIPFLCIFSSCANKTNPPDNTNNQPSSEQTTPINPTPSDNNNNNDDDTSPDVDTSTYDSYDLWEYEKKTNSYSGSYLDFVEQNKIDDEISRVSKTSLKITVEVIGYYGGSGIIYSISNNDIYIITNCHVVLNASTFTIKTYNNIFSFSASLVGKSETYDIAVLVAKNCNDEIISSLSAVTFNLEQINLEQTCLAVGSPELSGIKPIKGKITQESSYHNVLVGTTTTEHRLIHHSAQISHGNSGGGLFDLSGKLIGITNGGLKNNSSVKLAIPATIVYSVTKNILANCKDSSNTSVIQCKLGISYTSTQNGNNLQTTISSIDSNSYFSELVNKGDELVSFKITSANETIERQINFGYELDDFISFLIPDSTLELKIKNSQNSNIYTLSATFSQLQSKSIA